LFEIADLSGWESWFFGSFLYFFYSGKMRYHP